jgi:DNA-binding winged helix-turn-helix (wHTH) protein
VEVLHFLFGDRVLDVDRRELRCGSETIAVAPQVFDVLVHLLMNRDRVVSRDDLIASVWGGRIVSDSTLASRISAARTAIGDSGDDQRMIRTLARKGFRFVGDVRERRSATPVASAVVPAAGTGSSSVVNEATSDPQRRDPSGPPSLVVLPFTNLSGDPEQEYFADGIVDVMFLVF